MKTFNNPDLPERFVVFSETLGMFLGVHDQCCRWSRSGPVRSIPHAPTFDKEELKLFIEGFTNGFPEHRALLVHPDLPGNLASQNACANAGLERWSPLNAS
jgi:hypothetical protein